jgi:hypothetical protein
MRRSATRLSLVVAVLVAVVLAAGCGSGITSSIGSLPSRTATVSGRPSVTAAPTAQPPTHSGTTVAPVVPSSVPATPAASSGTGLIWLWVLLGVLVVAGLIALIVRSARRRSAAGAGSRSRLIDAYAKGSGLHDAMSVAEAPGGLASADAAARWSDIQRRADDLAQTLYALREAVPQDSADRARIDDTLASRRPSARRWTPSGPPAAPVMSRPTSSAAVWPPSNPPSGRSGPLAGNDQSLMPEVP